MTDLKDRFKEKLSDAADLATEARKKTAEFASEAARKAADLASETGSKATDLAQEGAKQAVEAGKKTADYATEAGQKAAELARTGADQAAETGKSLYSRLKGEEQAELKELGEQQTLAELSEDQQDDYLRSLLPVLVPFDPIDPDKLRRIYQILTVMELGKRRRRAFFEELFFSSETPADVASGSLDELTRLSLGKDLLGLSGQDPDEDRLQMTVGLLHSLRLSNDQIEVLSQWTSWENQMLGKIGRGDLAVDQEDMPLEAMKKAGAIGVPLAALYASGSVVGFGAAGITSGLATLGAGSGLVALGLNPMTAGIAALVLVGVGVKKLLDAQVPTTQGDKQKKLDSAGRAMQARRNRYLAMLSQDLIGLRRTRPKSLPDSAEHRLRQAVSALEDLLEREAEVTLWESASA